MEALKSKRVLSRRRSDKGKQQGQVAEFMNRACLRDKQLGLRYFTEMRDRGKNGKIWWYVNNLLYKDQRERERAFCSSEILGRCITSVIIKCGGAAEEKKKVTSPLMASWWCHITTHRFFGLQVNQLLCVLIGRPAAGEGGGCVCVWCFFSLPVSGLILVPEWAHLLCSPFFSSLSPRRVTCVKTTITLDVVMSE